MLPQETLPPVANFSENLRLFPLQSQIDNQIQKDVTAMDSDISKAHITEPSLISQNPDMTRI
jgi:hypothetical protein